MKDEEILKRIDELVREEHELEGRSVGRAGGAGQERLEELNVTLDQCWDLLRQRRARRAAGENPDEASVRDAGTVEHYLQ